MTTRRSHFNHDLGKILDDGRLSYIAEWRATVDVPLLNDRLPPVMRIPTVERRSWEIRQPGETPRYVTIGNNGELWVVDGTPSQDYAPSK